MSLIGCESVLTTQPIGNTVVQLSPEQWQGTWLSHEGGVATITVLDKDNGLLQASQIELRKDGPHMVVFKGTVRATGDKTFFVTRDA
jgi:hypothetical protein